MPHDTLLPPTSQPTQTKYCPRQRKVVLACNSLTFQQSPLFPLAHTQLITTIPTYRTTFTNLPSNLQVKTRQSGTVSPKNKTEKRPLTNPIRQNVLRHQHRANNRLAHARAATPLHRTTFPHPPSSRYCCVLRLPVDQSEEEQACCRGCREGRFYLEFDFDPEGF